jgi:hypothetical protein
MNKIFSQSQDASTLQGLHSEDEKSAWFGIVSPEKSVEESVAH